MRDLPLVADLSGALASARAIASLRDAVRDALACRHLVDVARGLGTTDEVIDALGVPVDVLAAFSNWRQGERTFAPTPLGLRVVPAGAACPLGTLRVQLSPAADTVPWALRLARTLVRAGEDVVIMAEPGADREALRALVGARVVEMRSATVFARDAALPARDAEGRPVLLLPRAFEGHRSDDAIDPALAAAAFGVEVRRSALHWEGGNLLYDGVRLLVGADTVRENCARLGLTAGEVLALFAAELGEEPLVLGDVEASRFDVAHGQVTTSGQAAFHIDLDVAPLGRFGRNRRPRALVADVALGLDLAPAILAGRPALFRGHFLPPRRAREQIAALWDERARAEHPRLLAYAAALEGAGYRVFGVPDLRIEPRENIFRPANFDLGYCNVLVGLAGGQPAVRWLPWGIPELDGAAAAVYRRAGVRSVRLGRDPRLAHGLMAYQGGLRCATGGLPRSE